MLNLACVNSESEGYIYCIWRDRSWGFTRWLKTLYVCVCVNVYKHTNLFSVREWYTFLKILRRLPSRVSQNSLTVPDTQTLPCGHCIYLSLSRSLLVPFWLRHIFCSGKGSVVPSGFDEEPWLSYLSAVGTWVPRVPQVPCGFGYRFSWGHFAQDCLGDAFLVGPCGCWRRALSWNATSAHHFTQIQGEHLLCPPVLTTLNSSSFSLLPLLKIMTYNIDKYIKHVPSNK